MERKASKELRDGQKAKKQLEKTRKLSPNEDMTSNKKGRKTDTKKSCMIILPLPPTASLRKGIGRYF